MARAVTNSRRNEHVKHVLASLHWLPVEYRVQFKIAVTTFKVLTTQEPSYLSELIRSIHHHVTCGPVAAIAYSNIESNLRLLRERFVMQHP